MAGEISISGVGETAYARRSERNVVSLAVEAVKNAAADAGLELGAIDGLIPIGSQITADDVMGALGLPLRFVSTTPLGGAAAVANLQLAEAAIHQGAASNVVILLAHKSASHATIDKRVRSLPGQTLRTELEIPYGWQTPAQWYAMICRRHMHEWGTTKDHMAAVALTMRANAQLNPGAMMYGRPMTREDYDAAPPIVDPYQRLDCSLETDGAAAVVIGVDGRAGVRVAGVGVGRPSSPDDLSNRRDWMAIGLSEAAPRVYEQAGIGPADVDAAMIYDCFTFEVIHQLEEAGFFPRGEAGPRIAAGAIALDGELPVNPHGGLLSEGHLGGLNHVVEAVRQLRGVCGERQLPAPERIAVTGWGGMGDGSMAILERAAG